MKNNKILFSVIAVAMAAVLLIGGTFAWQNISQQALNEKEDTVNPGGRLHDDFNGENKDVYVENFAEEPIFARIRLDEYFEITVNKGTAVEDTRVITADAVKDDPSTYITHLFGEENVTDEYFTWSTGGQTVYMPTFNMNKDSLEADINGTFENNYEDYVEYAEGDDKTENALYDNDSNNVDDGNVFEVEETHYATYTAEATLISMDEWMNDYDSEPGDYWVYDVDGWVYYAKPISAGEATGLLLDKITLNRVMDDSYYYAINVVGQFITADDLGNDDNTGFFDVASEAPSENAIALLKAIGVKTEEEEVEKPGLYSEDGTMLCAWEDCGIDLTPSEELDMSSNYETVPTSGCYVLKNDYSDTVKIVLPDDATEIGEYVFADCRNLREIDIKNVSVIGNHAFDYCYDLTTVTGGNIAEIGDCSFRSCQSLSALDLSNVVVITDGALQDTGSLTELDLSNVRVVETYALYCAGAKSLDLRKAITLENSALNCSMAEVVYLDEVESIGYYVFSYMSCLREIVYKDVSYTDVDLLTAAFEENGVSVDNYAFEDLSFYQPEDE